MLCCRNYVVKKLVVVNGSLDTAKAWTIGLEQICLIAAGIAGLTAVVILAVIGVINRICQKTQSNPDADADAGDGDPDETTSVISTTSGGKDDTNDSYEMVDNSSFCSVDMEKKKLGDLDIFRLDNLKNNNNSNDSNNNSQKNYSNN
ncbi:5'-AMP-activated serine/threonine-protein kinase catalytic subunit alpha-like isoform X2 [Sinocyclocheilus anshuiensis]|uniref:5'-AMP-activated serine/threonine-protein kinase catalytic subunit alpha-like isoform X2 n=1 Tax=Sinocyclocheilus anshuiensis TaxID=1608454 RepID=UPI0007BA100C|nr:PREDICTED: 5'-AMP-activated serine/threonine-protein kinase catalytic subunit alpha-like isoform X2 [Sinocyclocheilus anshuiensis]